MGLYDYQPANFNLKGSLAPSTADTELLGQSWGTSSAPMLNADQPKFGGMVGPESSGSSGSNWWDSVLGSKDTNGIQQQGWGGLALGTAQGLMNGFMGMQQYGIAKQQLAQGKQQFAQNYAAQRQTTNAAMEDKFNRQLTANPGAYAYKSVGDYMNEHRIA